MGKDSLIFGELEDDSRNAFALNEESFSELIFNRISIHGKSTFMIDGISGKSETFEDVCNKAKVLANSLLRLGVTPRATIAVSCENRMEYAHVMLASVFAGLIFAPINPTYSPDEIVHVLGISKPCLVFCSAFTLKNIANSLTKLEGIRHVVVFDDVSHNPSIPMVKYSSLLQNKPIEKPHLSRGDEVMVILTSSGTTGLPKGVMLSYNNIRFFCDRTSSRAVLHLQPDSIILGLLPLYHGYGYGLLMASAIVGNNTVLLPKFEEKLFLSTIQKYKINFLFMVPPLMVFLGKHPLVTQYDLTSVREVVCGAAPLAREVSQMVQTRLPGVELRQGYGMTESSIAITITPPRSNLPDSVGKLVPGVVAKEMCMLAFKQWLATLTAAVGLLGLRQMAMTLPLIDTETGKPVERGQLGEILVRGPCVMAGYCGDPKATRETIDSEGWLHTGDIGLVDSDGFFYIVDRLKELIKYKGYQVAPAELEAVLLGMSGVRDAAVVGMPDMEVGELPVAFVVLQPNTTLNPHSIMKYVNGKLSPQKRLRDVKIIESIPRNPSGKILRRILRDSLKAKL